MWARRVCVLGAVRSLCSVLLRSHGECGFNASVSLVLYGVTALYFSGVMVSVGPTRL